MNYRVLVIAIVIGMTGCFASAQKEDYGRMEAVNQVEMSKKEIFDRIMIWVASSYNAPKSVIQYRDRGQGIIAINGAFELAPMSFGYSYMMHYKITINVKDGRYRMRMNPTHYNNHEGKTFSTIHPSLAEKYGEEFNRLNSKLLTYLKQGGSDW